jgi:hypothetical protein
VDLAVAANVPEEVTLGGKPYRIRLLTMRERGVLQGFLKSKLVSPVTRVGTAIDEARAAGAPLSKAAVDQLYERAEAAALAWPPRFGSRAWFDAMDGIEGGYERLLFEVVSKVDLAFTIEQAEGLAPDVTNDEWFDLVRVAFWGTPPAPKKGADASPTPASPSATTGQGSSPS